MAQIHVVAVLILSSTTSTAWAQNAATPVEAATKPAPRPALAPADEHYRAGIALYKLGKFAEAETAFEAAFALKKTYDIAVNLGDVESQLGKFVEAATHLAFALTNWPPSATTDARAAVERALNGARKRVGALRIVVSQTGAQILVDGKAVGSAPLEDEVFVEPGARVVEAKLEGFESAPVKVEAKAGAALDVKLELTPVKAKVPPPPVLVVDEAAVKRRKIVLIAGGAATAISLGLGIGFTVAANGKASDADAQRAPLGPLFACGPLDGAGTPACDELHQTVKSQQTFGNAAIGMFVTGGVLAAGTAGFAIWQWMNPVKPKEAAPAARVVPIVSSTQPGVAVIGVW